MAIGRIIQALRQSPDAERLKDKKEVQRLYSAWRYRVLGGALFGYSFFYFCRKNIAAALPSMSTELGSSTCSSRRTRMPSMVENASRASMA